MQDGLNQIVQPLLHPILPTQLCIKFLSPPSHPPPYSPSPPAAETSCSVDRRGNWVGLSNDSVVLTEQDDPLCRCSDRRLFRHRWTGDTGPKDEALEPESVLDMPGTTQTESDSMAASQEVQTDTHADVETQAETTATAASSNVDDLFGDDDENADEDVDDLGLDLSDDEEDAAGASAGATRSDINGIDQDDANAEEEEQDEDEEEDEEELEEAMEQELKEADISLQRHPRSHIPKDHNAYSFPLPRFLFVDPNPFNPNNFEQEVKDFVKSNTAMTDQSQQTLKSSMQFKKLQFLNTIRWRYAKSNENELFKQSNANIVEWDDGSMSLKLGTQYFDIKKNKNDDNIVAFQNGETLMSLLNLNNQIQILPPSMKSKAHQFLASTLSKNMKLKRSKTINTIVTSEDPEAKAREVSRVQKEIEKAKRRQLAKIQLQEEQMGRSSNRSSPSIGSSSYGMGIDADEDDDEYDDVDEDDDGFIDDNDQLEVDDDDELDKAAERLKQVKRKGAEKYRSSVGEEKEEEEEEEAEEVDDDDDQEETVVRKKRKIVLDEDDE